MDFTWFGLAVWLPPLETRHVTTKCIGNRHMHLVVPGTLIRRCQKWTFLLALCHTLPTSFEHEKDRHIIKSHIFNELIYLFFGKLGLGFINYEKNKWHFLILRLVSYWMSKRVGRRDVFPSRLGKVSIECLDLSGPTSLGLRHYNQ